MEDLTLAVVNITSWRNQCVEAEHYYGMFILINDKKINIENIANYSLNYIGDRHTLIKVLTNKDAIELNKKDSCHSWKEGDACNRFNSIEEIWQNAEQKYNDLKLSCDMILLYEGDKFSETKIFKK